MPHSKLHALLRKKNQLGLHCTRCAIGPSLFCWSRQTPAWNRSVHLDAPGQRHGQQPTPGVVKQDKSSGGSVDTTETRSDPQRVRMSSGERPIGAARGKPAKPSYQTVLERALGIRNQSSPLLRLSHSSVW